MLACMHGASEQQMFPPPLRPILLSYDEPPMLRPALLSLVSCDEPPMLGPARARKRSAAGMAHAAQADVRDCGDKAAVVGTGTLAAAASDLAGGISFRVSVVLPAGGCGLRTGSPTPKQVQSAIASWLSGLSQISHPPCSQTRKTCNDTVSHKMHTLSSMPNSTVAHPWPSHDRLAPCVPVPQLCSVAVVFSYIGCPLTPRFKSNVPRQLSCVAPATAAVLGDGRPTVAVLHAGDA